MSDATILIPTHDHPTSLPWAVRSALGQAGASIEVFVVGDGVDDRTREALSPFLDGSVRFFDNPKGPRHGEWHRHAALEHASGDIVCYLSDDDLLLPYHVVEMRNLLDGVDFAHSAPSYVETDGSLGYVPMDLESRVFRTLMLEGPWNGIALTGAAHTLPAYRRLPVGWHPAPPDVWTDLHMWRQFLALPGFRGRTGSEVTALHFPAGRRPAERDASELAEWLRRSREPDFRDQLQQELAAAIRRRAQLLEMQKHQLERDLRVITATRTWRLRGRLLRVAALRALLARSAAAR